VAVGVKKELTIRLLKGLVNEWHIKAIDLKESKQVVTPEVMLSTCIDDLAELIEVIEDEA
jgi:hypothetical protein